MTKLLSTTSKHAPVGVIAIFAVCFAPSIADAADLDLRLENAPDNGTLVFQVYEIAEGFELELLYQHDVLDRIGGGMDSVVESPIVDDDVVIKGVAIVTYVF